MDSRSRSHSALRSYRSNKAALLFLLVCWVVSAARPGQAQVNWHPQTVTVGPSPRCCMGSAVSPTLGGVVVFGGGDGATDYNDTWLWTDHWTMLTIASPPPIRAGAGMAYDAATGNIVMFGGRNDSTGAVLNDTWTFDGTAWTQLFPGNPPPGRAFDVPGMVYDAAAGNIVFFGGAGFGVYFDDTWTWNGSKWTQQFPATSPSIRRAPQVYDPVTGTVILFGGDGPGGVGLGDTWSWNGSTWTQLFPPNSPSARTLSQVAFDSLLNRVVLFGGNQSGGIFYDDTWVYDGSTWTQVTPITTPQNRYAGLMAYDPYTDSALMFSGYGFGGTSPRLDTWLLGP